ncbi:hypothetical protein CFBP6624_01680 [Agrobacterium tumefaciens]|uniref:Uncharacterized protein n=1 Tax=Agrobacterium tumefaciens TaxID=358 RepID=A0AAE6BII4_AGRTU|nr:hypothetical protein CFBP6624_01680 [Agrobacterium tumefaciens]
MVADDIGGLCFCVWGQHGAANSGHGIATFARGIPPSALPGISPSRGEIDSRQGPAFFFGRDGATQVRLANLPTCGGDARQGRGG